MHGTSTPWSLVENKLPFALLFVVTFPLGYTLGYMTASLHARRRSALSWHRMISSSSLGDIPARASRPIEGIARETIRRRHRSDNGDDKESEQQ